MLPQLRNVTTAYENIDIWDIGNYGCWCSKMANGRSHNHKKKPIDAYDTICKDWFKARKCITIEHGPCENLIDTFSTYRVNLDVDTDGTIGIYDNSEDHCYASLNYEGEFEVANCMVETCRIDHGYMKKLFTEYPTIETDLKTCTSAEAADEENGAGQTTPSKYCELTDEYPFAEMKNHERKRRSVSNYQLSKVYAKLKLMYGGN